MERDHTYYVYIMASGRYGTLYTGVTNGLISRAQQHKDGVVDGFTKKYGVNRLVYYEIFGDVTAAIKREKQLKRWRREWKIRVIEEMNPNWEDLQLSLIASYRRKGREFGEAVAAVE